MNRQTLRFDGSGRVEGMQVYVSLTQPTYIVFLGRIQTKMGKWLL